MVGTHTHKSPPHRPRDAKLLLKNHLSSDRGVRSGTVIFSSLDGLTLGAVCMLSWKGGRVRGGYNPFKHSAGKARASTFGQYPFTLPASSTRQAIRLAMLAIGEAAPYATLISREVSQISGKVKHISDAKAAFLSTASLLTPTMATFFFSYSGKSSYQANARLSIRVGVRMQHSNVLGRACPLQFTQEWKRAGKTKAARISFPENSHLK